MITVIIAGGSGTRLWPLSTPDYPKHLLKLIGERTLLQQAFDRASLVGDSVYVVTEKSHANHVIEQLPELDASHVLIEPGRRGTAHCIIFALDYIARHHDNDEPVAFIHSDHNVRDVESFATSLKIAAKNSLERHEITLIGIEPTFPSTGFGYIERGGVINDKFNVYDVKSFKEKPNLEIAKKYLASGRYLWNCGYFVGSVNTFLNEMERSAPELTNHFNRLANIKEHSGTDYNDEYLSFDNQVIDIALIEKAKSLAVVAASFDWMDVGSFKDLYSVIPQDDNGNCLSGDNIYADNIENSYVRNETNIPVAVIGLDDVVIVNTKNGLLVSRIDVSQRVGDIAKKIQKKIEDSNQA
jgi:mannose-1-phosphate guanylyltransferase/mannose-6-phosphate isomerase